MSKKKGLLLVLDTRIDSSDFLLINIYNANTEKEQVSVLNELSSILSNFENTLNHNVIFAGDFNIFFDASLDAKGATPALKSRSINKLIELNETFDLCDIWRIRNPKKGKYTFRQEHLSELFNKDEIPFSSHKIAKNMLKNLIFGVFFQLIIHPFFAQYLNEMN